MLTWNALRAGGLTIALGLGMPLLAACEDEPAEDVGEAMEETGERAGDAAEDAGDAAEDAAD
jgi:hypothetical protein